MKTPQSKLNHKLLMINASDDNTSSSQKVYNFETTALAPILRKSGDLFKPMNYLVHWSKQVMSSIRRNAEDIKKLWDNLSTKDKIMITLFICGVSVMVFTQVIMSWGLSALGFSAQGPVLGSIAAGWQTSMTTSGSLFAILQSAAMGGYGVGTVSRVISGAGVCTATGGGFWYWWTRGREKDKRD